MAAFSDTLADAVRFASPAGAEWRQRTTRMRLAALECQALHALTLAELQELAELEAQLQRGAQAKEVLLHLKAQPGGPFPHAELLHGRLLLAEDDDRGLFLFEMAATHDAALAHVTAEEGAQFLRRTRGKRAAELWAESLRSHAD
ncbi:hypothetical protein [Pseudoduganella lurida]|nr:hypothetical protein [Pseudoduganella lurida]